MPQKEMESEDNSQNPNDLFEPFSRLIPVYYKNKEYLVPEN